MEEQYIDSDKIEAVLALKSMPPDHKILVVLVAFSQMGIALRDSELVEIEQHYRDCLERIERKANILIRRTEAPTGGTGYFIPPEEQRNALHYLKSLEANRWN